MTNEPSNFANYIAQLNAHSQLVAQNTMQNVSMTQLSPTQQSLLEQMNTTYHSRSHGLSNQARNMLFDRLMGVNRDMVFDIGVNDFIYPVHHGDKVYIFFIHNDRAGYLEDNADLYPSDKLVTQVRLIWS